MEKSVYRARADSSSIFSFLLCIILLELGGGKVLLWLSNCKTPTTHLVIYLSYQQINTTPVIGHRLKHSATPLSCRATPPGYNVFMQGCGLETSLAAQISRSPKKRFPAVTQGQEPLRANMRFWTIRPFIVVLGGGGHFLCAGFTGSRYRMDIALMCTPNNIYNQVAQIVP